MKGRPGIIHKNIILKKVARLTIGQYVHCLHEYLNIISIKNNFGFFKPFDKSNIISSFVTPHSSTCLPCIEVMMCVIILLLQEHPLIGCHGERIAE